MIDTKTIEGLYALRLPAMAAALADQRRPSRLRRSQLRATPRAAGRQRSSPNARTAGWAVT